MGSGVAFVLSIFGLLFALVIVPLFPMLLVAAALWVLFKAFETRPLRSL
jgi:hypothetical protein